MSTVELEAVEKVLGQQAVLQGLSLAASDGERLSLLGPSGCGKTTTLNVIAGFLYPDSGVIKVDGQPLAFTPPHKRNMGVVFQNYALFPHLTVAANVSFGLQMRGLSKAEVRARVGETLELVRLEALGGRYPRQLSGGQQQRVALARALAIRPSVLLLDEPLSNLDTQLRSHVLDEIIEIQQATRVTMILVTHDHEEALAVSDRIAVMNAGKVEQIGTPTEIYHRPRNRFVAGFVGDSNFIEGRLTGRDGNQVDFAFGGGTMRVHDENPPSQADEATVLLRPENLTISAADQQPSVNSFRATVKAAAYLGSTWRVQLVLAGQVVTASVPFAGMPELREGEVVYVAWSPTDATILAS